MSRIRQSELKFIREDGRKAYFEGKPQRPPNYNGTRMEKLKLAKEWLRGFREAKKADAQ